jgi:hypothetical protein
MIENQNQDYISDIEKSIHNSLLVKNQNNNYKVNNPHNPILQILYTSLGLLLIIGIIFLIIYFL